MNTPVWNKNKSFGQKPSLTYEQVQAVKTTLVQAGTARDRALFSLAIDSSLRIHDLLRLRVRDVMSAGEVLDAVRVNPTKTKGTTGERVIFEPIPYTRQRLKKLIEAEDKYPQDYLFTRARAPSLLSATNSQLTECAYANLVKKLNDFIAFNSELYRTHSLRRTRPAYIYQNGPIAELCRSFKRVLCAKGERQWERIIQPNLSRRRCGLP